MGEHRRRRGPWEIAPCRVWIPIIWIGYYCSRGTDNLIGASEPVSIETVPAARRLFGGLPVGHPSAECNVRSSERPVQGEAGHRAVSAVKCGCLVAEEPQYLGHKQIWRCIESLMPGTGESGHGCRGEGGGQFPRDLASPGRAGRVKEQHRQPDPAGVLVRSAAAAAWASRGTRPGAG